MEKVKLALIGAGAMANAVHYPSLAEMPDVHLCALCELIDEKRQQTAQRFAIPRTYSDYREMLAKEDPDAVYVLTPPHHLFDIVVYCLKARKHVFIEKPPAVTTFQAEELARLAERNGCLTMVGFNRRFIPLLQRVREEQAKAGELNLAVAAFHKAQPEALYYDGAIDVLHCDAIHAVDALRWMGGDVVAVASHVGSSSSARQNRFVAVMEFASGASGVLLANWDSGARVHTFEWHAPGFVAYADPGGPDAPGQAVIRRPAGAQTISAAEAAGSTEFAKFYGFYAENRYFIDCLKRGQQPETCFSDAAKTMALADAILCNRIGR